MICFIDYCGKEIAHKCEKLEETMTIENHKKWSTVMTELVKFKEYEFTACGLFNINKSTGLSFISSLISFTALLQQVLSNIPHS
jgi:hypothetical protein